MILDDLVKKCEFDFSKASVMLKKTILTVATAATLATNPAFAKQDVYQEYLDEQRASYSQEIDSLSASQTKIMKGWEYLADKIKPDENGSKYLDKLEAEGKVQTPITYAEYSEIANKDFSDDGRIVAFRNPLSKDGIIVHGSRRSSVEVGFFEKMVREPEIEYKSEYSEMQKIYVENVNAYKDVSPSKPSSEYRKEAFEIIKGLTSGLKNDNIVNKFGNRARKSLTGGFAVRSYDVLSEFSGDLEAGLSRNGGSPYFFNDGETKINLGILYCDGTNTKQYIEIFDGVSGGLKGVEDGTYLDQKFIESDQLPIDRDLIATLSFEEEEEVHNATTLMHEVFHGITNSSTNSSQPSILRAAFQNTYNTTDFSSFKANDITLDEGNAAKFSGSYFRTFESRSDMAMMTIAAAGMTDAQWELAKLSQQALRKQRVITGNVVKNNVEPNLKMSYEGMSEKEAEKLTDGNSMEPHDIAMLSNGWVIALDKARKGEGNTYLLELASDPVKLAMSVTIADAMVARDLSRMTNDWTSIPSEEYSSLVQKGTESMLSVINSQEFQSIVKNLDTSALEPSLTGGTELAQKMDEVVNRVENKNSGPKMAL